jgi:hypothetical protein
MPRDASPLPPRRRRRARVAAGVVLVAGLSTLSGCEPPAGPTPAEAAAAALRAQGASDAQVQLQADSFRAVLTQRDGRQSLVAVGVGTVGPADFGVPWYPGAQADPARSSKVSGVDGQVASVVLRTTDPTERVLTFYRERLAAGEAVVRESTPGAGRHSFVVADDATLSASQVLLAPAAGGTEISLLTTRRAPK